MDITIFPKKLCGTVSAISSKSQAHRLLICAAFSDKPTEIECAQANQDIDATAQCLNALGANIARTAHGYTVKPIVQLPSCATLNCHESGSTLRFMLPIVGALGVDTTFIMEGRLPQRPLSPLWEEMERMGCSLSRPTSTTIACCGQLQSGNYMISGGVSSQFITGLLFAMALIDGDCSLTVTGKIESKPYIDITQHALRLFGINSNNYTICASERFISPGRLSVEGDWSNGAFLLAAQKIGSNISVTGLDHSSKQGDRAVTNILRALDNNCVIDAADIPDLVPILAVAAGALKGATFINISRLRLKESDRVETVAEMLKNLGAVVTVTENTLRVDPAKYRSCTINAHGDHRIAMSAAVAATVAEGPVTILDAHCVAKSYPSFWEDYRKLGGHYEQHVR